MLHLRIRLPRLRLPDKNSLILILALGFCFAFIGVMIFLKFGKGASANWYDDNFRYRQPITFTHNAAISNDRSVTFSLDTAELITDGVIQSDCDDIRFTDINGKTLFYQLTGTCNNAATTFEVIFPSIINGGNAGYVYYGNAGSQSASQNVASYTTLTPSGGDPAITTRTAEEKGPGPIAAWGFDEGYGSIAHDRTTSNYNGVITNAVWKSESECISGKCLYFDGTGDYVSMGDFYSDTLTVCAWVRPNVLNSAADNIVVKRNNSSNVSSTNEFQFYISNTGAVSWSSWNASSVSTLNLISTKTVPLNSWSHVCAVQGGAGNTGYLYIDGKQAASSTQGAAMIDSATVVQVGTWSAGDATRYFEGYIDDVKIYPYARTSTQINTDYISRGSVHGLAAQIGNNPGNTGENLTHGLSGYWKFDETATPSLDSSGVGSTGTWGNNTSHNIGKYGNSIVFDGTDDYINIADNDLYSLSNTNQLTVASWVKFNALGSRQTIISKGSGSNYEWDIRLESDNTISAVVFTAAGGTYMGGTTTTTVSSGPWYHVAMVIDTKETTGPKLEFYLNGQLVTTYTSVSGSYTNGSAPLRFGERADAVEDFKGAIDEARIYNRALSSSEVLALYNFAPPPIAYWKLDDKVGDNESTIVDSSGNGYTATIGSSTNPNGGVLVSDTFTESSDTALASHLPDVGVGWTSVYDTAAGFLRVTGASDILESSVGTEVGTGEFYAALPNPTEVNQSISITLKAFPTDTNTRPFYIFGRRTDNNNMYAVRILSTAHSTASLILYKVVGGTDTALGVGGTGVDITWNADDVIKLVITDTDKKVYVNDVEKISDSDNSLTAAGTWGVGIGNVGWIGGNISNAWDIDNFSAEISSDTTSKWVPGKYGSSFNFDGRNDYLTVADNNNLDLASDFTIDLWFSPESVFNASANYMQGLLDKGVYSLFLDKSDGKIKAEFSNGSTSWSSAYDGSTAEIVSLAVYNGKLYAGLGSGSGNGDVLVYDGSSWTTSYNGSSFNIYALTVYNGNLYAAQGSTIAGDGDVIVFDGSAWSSSYNGSADRITSLAVYNNKLYAGQGSLNSGEGDVFVYDGSSWSTSYNGGQLVIQSLAVYNGKLYAGEGYSVSRNVLAFDGSSWTSTGGPGLNGSGIKSLAVYNGKLYAGNFGANSGEGDIYVYDGSSWTLSYNGSQYIIRNLLSYNGNLYATQNGQTAGAGDILMFDGSSWTTSYDGSQETFNALANYKGKLYAGQGNSSGDGDVYVLDGATQIESTSSSWSQGVFKHVSLKKNNTLLSLSINGIVESSVTLPSATIQANSLPLLIGSLYGTKDTGADQAFFNGSLDDIRIYDYARSSGQIVEDMNAGHPLGGSPVGSQVSYWKFDEGYGSTAYDSSININNGTLGTGTSAPTWTNDGKFGKALLFDGTLDNISIPAITLDETFTISHWIKTTSSASQMYTIGNASSGDGYRFGLTGGKIAFLVGDSGGNTESTCGNTTVNDNQWHYIAGVYDNTQTKFTCYIDGKLAGNVTTTDFADMQISATPGIGNPPCCTDFIGSLDELKVYSAALTSAQIQIDYNRGKAVVFGATSTSSDGTTSDNSASREYCIPGDTSTCNAPVGEWKLDENTGTTAQDTSGNAQTGTLNGSMNNSNWVPGNYSSALVFDGTDDRIDVASSSLLDGLTTTTVSFWAKAYDVSLSKEYGLLSFYKSGTDRTYIYLDNAAAGINVMDDIADKSTNVASTNFVPTANQWFHVSLVMDGTNWTTYINGIRKGQTANTNTLANLADGYSLVIGARLTGGTDSWRGEMDQIQIYNYARSPAQIAWDYNKGAPLVHYKLDECQGTTAYNSALNANGAALGYNGTITIGSSGTNTSVGTCVGTSSHAWKNGATGKVNSGLYFDGVDDYLLAGTFPALNGASQLSVAGWLKRGGVGTTMAISKEKTDGTDIIFIEPYSDGKVYFGFANGSYADGEITLADAEWHHYVLVFDGSLAAASRVKAYIDGKYRPFQGLTGTFPTTSAANSTTAFYIGREGDWTSSANGYADDVRFYNYALTPVQVKTIYNNGAVSFK